MIASGEAPRFETRGYGGALDTSSIPGAAMQPRRPFPLPRTEIVDEAQVEELQAADVAGMEQING